MAKNEGGNKKKSYSKIKVANSSAEELPYEKQMRSSRGTSQEYQDYVNFKASIVKKDQEVQYDITDLNVIESEESIKGEEQIDLSRRALRVFILERQIEKYASNLKNAEILKKQQEAIKLIRQKIAEVKKYSSVIERNEKNEK
ncbi:hypothetical protein WA026_002477 [Henosepilachna vigintioctopunctata]|uniref:Uncharacterized protein n=1 Tax=Henosepilachna vigintioctopunctata TaxID=420089 RepID=A0AAW1U407_9CUCU